MSEFSPSSYVILGANGQLGTALRQRYPEAQALSSSELDITDLAALEAYDWSGVSTILNAAAYTNVDGAETPEGRLAAWKVNATGVRNLAQVAQARALTLFHISSEYVFDGSNGPHQEDEPFSPLGVYAQSKAAGDLAASLTPQHYILRTSWVIGDGKNFVRTMLSLADRGISPSVVGDQIGRLTFTDEIVDVIEHFIATKPPYGTYNVSNGGEPVSWADITRAIFTLSGHDELTVTNTTTAEYFADKPNSAPRPLLSTLDLAKLQATGFTPSDWQTSLNVYIEQDKPKEIQS